MKSFLGKEKLTIAEVAAAIALGVSMAALVMASIAFLPSYPSHLPDRKYIVDKATKERMRYHGTSSVICDGSDCWFYREGKKVRF
jgi:hypothetical protein